MKIRLGKRVVKLKGDVEWAEKKNVTSFGNGAKIDFYKEFIGQKVLVVVLKER